MDHLSFIMDYESGQIETEEELIKGFQEMIDSGIVWSLQGSYGRMAKALIDEGYCTE